MPFSILHYIILIISYNLLLLIIIITITIIIVIIKNIYGVFYCRFYYHKYL